MTFELTFSEIELASTAQKFVAFSPDFCTEEAKKLIMSSQGDELMKITKTMASPIKITKAEKVTDEMLANAL